MSKFRDKYRYRPGRSKRRPMLTGGILLALIALLLFVGYTKKLPFKGPGGYTVSAEFADATHLQRTSDVRVRGISVGKVEKVRLSEDAKSASVRIRMKDDSGVVVYRNARAGVFWRTLLGRNTYIELDPGTPAGGLLAGGTIPLKRTTVQEELDAVVSPLGNDQRKAVRVITKELDRGFEEQDDVRTVIDRSGDAGANLRKGLKGLRGQNPGDLTALVRSASRTMGALSRSETDLGGLIDSSAVALGVTAAKSNALGAAIDKAPATLADTRTTLMRLERTLDELDPVTVGLVPGAKELKASAVAARPLLAKADVTLRDAEPTLRDLQPAVRNLRRVAQPATAAINALNPTVDRLNDDLLPFLGETDPETKMKNYTAIGAFSSVMASAASTFDANGHILNFQSFLDERSLVTLGCTTRLTDPSAPVEEKIDCSNLAENLAIALGQKPPRQLGDSDPAKDENVGDRATKKESR